MYSRNLRLAMAGIVALVVTSSHPSLGAKRTSPCDTDPHGQYTSMLCPGDHLVPNSYLTNGNETHRFYFDGNGSSYIMDVTTNPWTTFREIYMGGTIYPPSALIFDPAEQPEWSSGSAVAFNIYDELEYGIWNDQELSGDRFMRLDNDGCLRFYDDDGSHVYLEFCSL